ncbi:hypothetical protein GCM10027160_07200 [Streptomyces calidiresistens]
MDAPSARKLSRLMGFVKAEWDERFSGFQLDADAYRSELPALRNQLLPGAWSLCSEPDHYRFSSRRCVKDLVGEAREERIGATQRLRWAGATMDSYSAVKVPCTDSGSWRCRTIPLEYW